MLEESVEVADVKVGFRWFVRRMPLSFEHFLWSCTVTHFFFFLRALRAFAKRSIFILVTNCTLFTVTGSRPLYQHRVNITPALFLSIQL